ncbi:serine/threonine-protein kinase [Streptomyces sp. NPDC001480]|uniref:serine/threonine-protein kinase n=1 Tax=Streptomyces sp. NPDC001480 TaxID=3364577 RepID=UPI0036760920
MRSPEPTDPPAVGGYPLLARLGAGGMGQVYLSRTPSGRPLALKTVRAELGLEPGFEERFAREVASSDRVRSPWTVTVVDHSPPGQRPQWLATEYVPAPSLADWVERHGPLPEAAVRALAAELAEALRAVHRAGLAHRDVKPSNILLGRRHPLLIDFGIARAADDTRHTRTGGVVGSPGYMAPEQAVGGGAAEPGDVFCLAAVLAYAATGHGPFLRPGEEPSVPRLLYRVVHEEPVLDGVPASLLPLLTACLHKTPEARPTADALLERLGAPPDGWAAALPPGLEAELASREEELRAVLERPAVLAPPAPPHPPGFGPPSGYATPAVPPAPGFPPARGPGPVPERSRRGPRAAVLAGAVAVAAVVTTAAVVLPQILGGEDDKKSAPSPSPSTAGAADTLPASWVGTWKGTGPGDRSADGVVNVRTTRVSVSVTLHAAARGELVGSQTSHVIEAGTGRDVGCTETLLLRETHRTTMVFEAASSAPTDTSASVTCVKGNVYTLTMTVAGTLALGDEGSQTTGAPSRLTRAR